MICSNEIPLLFIYHLTIWLFLPSGICANLLFDELRNLLALVLKVNICVYGILSCRISIVIYNAVIAVADSYLFCSVILLPIAITFYITWWFIHFVDGFFSPIYAQLGIEIFGKHLIS